MEAERIVRFYFRLGLPYTEMVAIMANTHGITFSERSLKRKLRQLGLSRQKNFTNVEEVIAFIEGELRGHGQMHGYRWMHRRCILAGMTVRRDMVRDILAALDPEGVHLRRRRRLVRRRYISPGPNFAWHVDSYDKLKRYGIAINGCIDGFSRNILWLKADSTNNNPRIISGYFIRKVESIGGCPSLIWADRGTENGGIEIIQTFLRRNGDDQFAADRSFRYGASHHNQRIESWWAFLRKHWTQFWIEHFAKLSQDGYFDGSQLDKNIVQFCFTRLIQNELDRIEEEWNAHPIRSSRNANGPFGRPLVMYNAPDLYGTRDFVHPVPQNEVLFCKEEETDQNVYPCDQALFELCCIVMEENNIAAPEDLYQATDLYINLRNEVRNLLEL